MVSLILGSVWFFLPAGIANMMPVIAAKLFGPGRPIDGGAQWRGKPLFGSHKTWQGLVAGTIGGGAFFLLQQWAAPHTLALNIVDYAAVPWYFGLVLGFGALLGDLAKSFFKRRVGVSSGRSWIPFDQIDYIIGGLALGLLFVNPGWTVIIVVLVSYFLLHVIVNSIGYLVGLRESWL